MAWICISLENTLIQQDPESGETVPLDGAIESVAQLTEEGHRLTVLTERFAPMPASEKQRVKEEIELELQTLGFPPMEVWAGTTMPNADAFIGRKGITFDDDWALALAQLQAMLEDSGAIQGPQPGAAETAQVYGTDTQEEADETPQEGN